MRLKIAAFLKSKLFFSLLLGGTLFLALPSLDAASFFANPLEYILFSFGNAALYLFLINAYLPFFVLITPKSWGLASLKSRRRALGISCFFFAVLHASVYYIDNPEVSSLSDFITEARSFPFILVASLGLLILALLSLTSNKLAMKKLGKTAWKKLHRLNYLLIPILAFHITAKDKGNPSMAIIIFTPLICSYLIRLLFYYKTRPT